MSDLGKPRYARAYGFGILTFLFFALSWTGQAVAQYFVIIEEGNQHGYPVQLNDYLWQFAASTLANWQSEFLQLWWQVAGLAMFYHWGSSHSRERQIRIERKLDALLLQTGRSPDLISREVNENL